MQPQGRLPGADYFTDLDMHLDDGQLSNYQLLLSVWSEWSSQPAPRHTAAPTAPA